MNWHEVGEDEKNWLEAYIRSQDEKGYNDETISIISSHKSDHHFMQFSPIQN